MDERNQSLEGGLVALPPFQKQPGDLRGVVRNAAILSLFAWCTVSRPVSLYRQEVCYVSLPWIRIWDSVGWRDRPRVESGEFSVTADGGATISGRIVSASEMAGTISVPSCTTTPLMWRVSRGATDRGRLSSRPVTAFTLFPQFPAFQAERNFVP